MCWCESGCANSHDHLKHEFFYHNTQKIYAGMDLMIDISLIIDFYNSLDE